MKYLSSASLPKTCLASARLSSPQQISGESLEDQSSVIKQFAKDRGLTILPDGEVGMEIFSATVRRPVYEEHIEYIKNNPGKVGYYIIRFIDRFVRSGITPYEQMKEELANLGVMLLDVDGVIQEARLLPELEEIGYDAETCKYDWAYRSPSAKAETMAAFDAKQDRDVILQRTIPKQMKYVAQGYHVGRPDDGFLNKQIQVDTKKRYIQARDPERAPFIERVFELRADGGYTDEQIVAILNDEMGYLSKPFDRWNKTHTAIIGTGGRKRLTVKQMHDICERVSYAGVVCEKWTNHKPIRSRGDQLVSIDIWNKANRGKLYIKEYPDGSLELLHHYKSEKPVYQRLRHNKEYPFKCVLCPICNKKLKGSAPKGRNNSYPQYHCSRGHKAFSVSREDMNQTIEEFLEKVKYSDGYMSVLREVLVRKLRQRQADALQESKNLNSRVSQLKSEKEQTVKKLVQTESGTVTKILEEQLEKIEIEIKQAESFRFSVDLNEHNIEDLVGYAKKIVESPKKALIDKDNPLRQEQLFKLFFDDLPTYQELLSGTAKKRFLFNANCVIETPQNDEESLQGRLSGIEPESKAPQTSVLTVTP